MAVRIPAGCLMYAVYTKIEYLPKKRKMKSMKRIIRITLYVCACVLLVTSMCCCDGDVSDETGNSGDTSAIPITEEENAETSAEETVSSIFDGDVSGFEFTQAEVCTDTIPQKIYSAFFKKAAKTDITVPGLPEYFVPQGMDMWDEEGVLIISGYFNPTDKYQYSVLFAVDAESGEYVGEWKLYEKNGSPHSGHDGGVAVTETDIYLSTSSTLFRISLENVRNVGNHGNLTFDETIGVPVRASYCNYSCGILWVGEFSLQGNSSYTITGHDYSGNHAWTVGYRLGEDGKIGSSPDIVISTPEKIQGFTMLEDGRIFMTCSYGRTNDSTVYITKSALLEGESASTVKISGKNVPIYYTKSYETVNAIPMTEGCTARGGTAYILFESGAYYYRDASSNKAKYPTDKIWTFDVSGD